MFVVTIARVEGGRQVTRHGGEGVTDQGRWRWEGRDVGARGVGARTEGTGRSHVERARGGVEEWTCQKGRSHEGSDVEGDSGPLRVSPR